MKTTVDVAYYKKLLHKLRANEESISREKLEGKYAKAYFDLRNEIKNMTNQLIRESLLDVLLIEREQEDVMIDRINMIIEDCGFLQNIQRAVFKYKCYMMVKNEIAELKALIEKALAEQYQ